MKAKPKLLWIKNHMGRDLLVADNVVIGYTYESYGLWMTIVFRTDGVRWLPARKSRESAMRLLEREATK